MKRIFIYSAMILALAFAANGCSQDSVIDTPVSSNLKKVVINTSSTIGSIDGNSRATLNDLTPVWEDDDAIGVIIDNNDPQKLFLSSGSGTKTGSFSGEINVSDSPQNMYFYYPASAADADGVDLTKQDGAKPNEMVMFGCVAYSTKPIFKFANMTSILKFNMAVPTAAGWNESTEDLTATIYGAYSKGKLSKEGQWRNLEQAEITVSNVTVKDGYITGYAVVIPGSNVKDLHILVGNATKKYITNAYTSETATIPKQKVITIKKEISEVLVCRAGGIQETAVKEFFGTGKDWTIFAAEDMNAEDFKQLSFALTSSDINLNILNQTTLPDRALAGSTALKSIYAPHVTNVGTSAFQQCECVVSVSLPKAKTLGNQVFTNCSVLASVSLPKVETVGDNSFSTCKNLSSVYLPNATSVGTQFQNCGSLKRVYLPKVQSMGDVSFKNCTSLTTLYLPEVTNMGSNVFYGCNKAKISLVAKSGATWYGNKAIWMEVYNAALIWEPGVTTVNDAIQFYRANDNNLVIVSIEDWNYDEFLSFKSVLTEMKENVISAINLTLFDQTVFPTDVVPAGCLKGCRELGSLSAPNAKVIGEYAFADCDKLTTVYLPNAETVKSKAFYCCSSLNNVDLRSATEVAEDAFEGCTRSNINLTVKIGATWCNSSSWASVTQR